MCSSGPVFVTGGTGFVGRHLVNRLEENGENLTLAIRKGASGILPSTFYFDALSPEQCWKSGLLGHKVVVHCAARAHVGRELSVESRAEYFRVNVDATINLARQAAEVGVNRFVFISSIGVNGSANTSPFSEDDIPAPTDAYAQSKFQAELALMKLASTSGMEVVIIRPPLVYGGDAPGSFKSLMSWVEKGIPLPLGAINNQRTFVGVDNLVDMISCCIHHPSAANQIFLAGDGEDVSTTEFLHCVARAMGKTARLVPVPERVLWFAATCFGRRAAVQRLLSSLRVDTSKARNLLGWVPPYTLEQGLAKSLSKIS